jgi:hypothetical protein
VSALVLDAGALLAVEQNDRSMLARFRVAQAHGLELRTHPFVVAQVWRDSRGRQANLARLLNAVEIITVTDQLGRNCGVLLGKAGMSDPIDAAVVLIARSGDRIATSDPDDIRRLAEAAARPLKVIEI